MKKEDVKAEDVKTEDVKTEPPSKETSPADQIATAFQSLTKALINVDTYFKQEHPEKLPLTTLTLSSQGGQFTTCELDMREQPPPLECEFGGGSVDV